MKLPTCSHGNFTLTTILLFNGTIFHNRQGDSITTLINMILVEHQGTVLGYKITEHAREHAAIKSYHRQGEHIEDKRTTQRGE